MTESASNTLLSEGDPEPVELLRETGRSPFVLSAEHAGRCFPQRLGTLGLRAADLDRHIAWDIGIAGVTRRLSGLLDAPAVLQRYSRLVVDCNRWPGAADFVTVFSEDTEIPGNKALDPADVDARTREIFQPYHETLQRLLDTRVAAEMETVYVAMHSCTPVYLGVSRPWQVGVLYDRDPRFGRILLKLLRENDSLNVGDNEPYVLSGNKDYAVPVHGEQRGLPHVEFEIRQDLIETEDGQRDWAERIAEVLDRGLAQLRETGSLLQSSVGEPGARSRPN
ncbi:MAG: N-formylglutamate amidohydrolase [Gammaproteobacteria bacterium]|nr:N-formylglutamate amidohydrolase [Gammaproteobacteria bacterium]